MDVTYRPATTADIEPIAALHADSWRRHYRGAYEDEFLDGPVFEDRHTAWTARLTHPHPRHHTVVAEHQGELAGFAHTTLDHHPTWGALLDNLHISHRLHRQGIGTRLLNHSAALVMTNATHKRLYLMVLEQNIPARAFYEVHGAHHTGTETSHPPGGGTITGLRYTWPDPSLLLTEAQRTALNLRPQDR